MLLLNESCWIVQLFFSCFEAVCLFSFCFVVACLLSPRGLSLFSALTAFLKGFEINIPVDLGDFFIEQTC